MFRVLFIVLVSFCLYSKPLEIELNAKTAILINVDNNKVLFQKNAEEKIFPASLTKVATLYYFLDKYSQNLNDYYSANFEALRLISPNKKIALNYKVKPYILESDGSSFEIIENEKLKLKDLLFGLMISSGNDAANVICQNLSGSFENFIEDFNKFLKLNGCIDTNFLNPHGLHMPDHMTTAKDLAYLTSNALKNPNFLEFFSCKYFLRPQTNKQSKKEKITYIELFKPGKNYYKYVIGAKTGYTSKAKYNLIALAKKKDRNIY